MGASPPGQLRIRGARQHNLANVDLDLPLHQLVVLCGPSGSGKSSLAFDTVFAEGQRRYLAALGQASKHGLLPPAVDELANLPPTLALRQRDDAPPSHARLAEVAELLPPLRLLAGRFGVLHCPLCGRPVRPVPVDGIVDAIMGWEAGSRVTLEAPLAGGLAVLDEVREAGFSRVRWQGEIHRVDDVPAAGEGPVRVVVDRIKLAADRRARVSDSVRLAARVGRGVVVAVSNGQEHSWVERPYCLHDDLPLPALSPSLVHRWTHAGQCPECAGKGCAHCGDTGLSPVARGVRWRGHGLADWLGATVDQLQELLPAPEGPEEGPLRELHRRLASLCRLGLGHRVVGGKASLLSAGELQRARLTRVVTAALGGVVVVLDEPAAGLDDPSAARVVEELRAVLSEGASVLAVSHHPVVLRAADHVVEFGPGAGAAGGQVVYDGPSDALRTVPTATGRWLAGDTPLPAAVGRAGEGWRAVGGHRVRRGVLGAVVGPSGSGKSAWLAELEAAARGEEMRIARADRAAGRSARSMVATYVGLWDVLRKLLAMTREATLRGLDPRSFSLNVKGGRCEACRGRGVRRIELDMLPDIEVPCEVCGGARFAKDVLEVRWKGLSAAELLDADAATLRPLLGGHPKLDAPLRALVDVGLGYLPLGRTTDGLSGGEARRLALARELVGAVQGTMYLLDDVTVGLHRSDVLSLLRTVQALVDGGGTVWMATHDADVAECADHRIDLG